MKDIKGFETFADIKPVEKGWSDDEKYCIEAADGGRLFLRIADISEYNRKHAEFDILKRMAESNVPACRPVDFGLCNNGKSVYQLLTWIDGTDADIVLPTLTETKQYILGLKAGELLRKIHTTPTPDNTDDWSTRYFAVMDERFEAYHRLNIHFEGDTFILNYLEANRDLLRNRPQCCHHSDFHPGNFVVDENLNISVIDWAVIDFDGYGDPWYEFRCLEEQYPYFSTGQINGYFDGAPPAAFWRLYTYYTAAGALTSIAWATHFGEDLVNEKLKLNRQVLSWFDNMRNPVPTWYMNGL